jgi:hypothetical protein
MSSKVDRIYGDKSDISNKTAVFLSILLLSFSIFAMYFSFDKGYELYALAAVFGFGVLYLFVKYPKLWIYSIMLSSFVFFHASSEGISVVDVLTALVFNLFLYIWIFWELFVNRGKLVKGIQDWFILAFFGILIFNLFIAIFIGTPAQDWLNEYILSSTLLLYFPVRKYFTEAKDLRNLLIVFGISAVLAALYHLNIYRESILEKSLYVFELGGSLKVNQALYTICTAVGLMFLLNTKKLLFKTALLLFVGLQFLSLIISFSRTFWLLFFIMVIALFIFFKAKRLKIIIYSIIFSLTFVISVLLIFPDQADFVFGFFERRLSSSSKVSEDISVKARYEEWDLVFDRIERYPLGGSGLAKKIHFYSFLSGYNWNTANIHNGYFALVHKVGIPFALFYFIPYFIFLFKAEWYARKIKDLFWRQIAIAAFLTLSMLVVGSITSNQFLYRDTIFQIMLAYAFIGILDNNKDKLIPEHKSESNDSKSTD